MQTPQHQYLSGQLNNTTRVKISKSLKVIGEFILEHDDGTEELINGKRSFCRCGLSKSMPFCDNSHRTITDNTRVVMGICFEKKI